MLVHDDIAVTFLYTNLKYMEIHLDIMQTIINSNIDQLLVFGQFCITLTVAALISVLFARS